MVNKSLPYVSVIIPVFNDSAKLKICLQKLEIQTYSQELYEIIVVDNNSTENIREVATEFAGVKITIEQKQGSYAARNKGIAIAKGEIIAFTDSDCIPAPDWIERGVETLQTTPNCGLVGGKIELVFKEQKKPNGAELFDSLNCLQQKHYIEQKHYGATANVFTYKEILETVGLFNTNLKSGGDLEWGRRVFAAGYQQVYGENVRIAHPARSSLQELKKKFTRLVEGKYVLHNLKDKPLLVFLKELYWDFKPPFKEIWGIVSNNKSIPSIRQRLAYIYVFLTLRFVTAYRKAQLYFSKPSKTSI